MKFDETDLDLFRHVAEAGSITHGAARANMALTAASARIRTMEARLGVQLFDRKRHGVALSPAGRSMLAHARQLLAQADRLREEIGLFQDGTRGHVRLFANTNSYSSYLPSALAPFLLSYPSIDIRIAERPSEAIIALVADGTADIGIVAAETDLADLAAQAVATDRYVVICADGHRLARSRRLDFAAVLDHDFVAGPSHGLFAAKAQRLGKIIRIRVRMRDDSQVCRLVAAGVGIGIVPLSVAAPVQQALGLHLAELRDAWALRRMFACVRDRAALSRPAQALYSHLIAGSAAALPVPGITRSVSRASPAE
ncbi:DNA-binding transcriptional regulator, LysR family [Bradyrhizobium sp. Ghvi]|nr:DNA-binding transcriptional regulator, LysR family [Bradyrhizobium sp. Ghvi]